MKWKEPLLVILAKNLSLGVLIELVYSRARASLLYSHFVYSVHIVSLDVRRPNIRTNYGAELISIYRSHPESILDESAMDASWAQSMFGMGFINLSGTCATTKLIQCRGMGLYECEVSRKFQKRPEDAPDLSRTDFLERKRVIDQMERWCNEHESKPSVGGIYKNEWHPILYDWEVCGAFCSLCYRLTCVVYQVAKSSAKKLVRRSSQY